MRAGWPSPCPHCTRSGRPARAPVRAPQPQHPPRWRRSVWGEGPQAPQPLRQSETHHSGCPSLTGRPWRVWHAPAYPPPRGHGSAQPRSLAPGSSHGAPQKPNSARRIMGRGLPCSAGGPRSPRPSVRTAPPSGDGSAARRGVTGRQALGCSASVSPVTRGGGPPLTRDVARSGQLGPVGLARTQTGRSAAHAAGARPVSTADLWRDWPAGWPEGHVPGSLAGPSERGVFGRRVFTSTQLNAKGA